MGWLANYRWLSSLDKQQLPKVDHAKRAATKAELKVAKRLRKAPGVLKVHHAVRLTKIEGGKSRREVDLIAVMQDRLVLIEVKNFNGVISMNDDGVLHQNGQSRGWTFAKLDDASKRLKDTMHLTGIRLGDAEIHSVLLFQGRGEVEDSVSTGGRLLDAHVAKTTDELLAVLNRPLGDGAKMNDAQMNAVQEFFARCGTWDELEANNGATLEGDFRTSPAIEGWRKAHRRMSFSNQRGWLTTVLFGPKFVAKTTGWNGQTSTVDVAFDEVVEMVGAGAKNTGFSIDHLASLTFGYSNFPDWENTVLMEVEAGKDPPQSKTEHSNQPPYRRGDIIRAATVSGIHEQHGIFFTLDKDNSGLYRKQNMEAMEWTMRDGLYRVGEAMDVKVLKIKRKGKSGWNIEVESAD
tara:strand:- start:101 stop:1318 length:1218 start_codon:yes stop_codon:yes gene_type:complete